MELPLVNFRNHFPLYQKRTPNKHHAVVKAMFVMSGGRYPASTIHGVMNLLKPYPHRFLLMVTVTKIVPATGLYESTAYVDTMAGSAAT